MDTKAIIEAVGYIGSALVVISFFMVSVVKLRVVNTIGSVIFMVYALIIHSYPTAIMNFILVFINIYHLIKLSNTKRSYDFVEVDTGDRLLHYTVDTFSEDIKKCFPGIVIDFPTANVGYVVCHKGKPAGIVIGSLKDGVLDLLLDYSTPEYRDFSIGKFLFSKLPEKGIKTVTYRGADENHKAYLSKTGFVNKGGYYEKEL